MCVSERMGEHMWVHESFKLRNAAEALEGHDHGLKENGMQQVKKLNNLYGQFYKGRNSYWIKNSWTDT